eukprot:5656701-Amphidinium_carterae.1
MKRNVIIFAWTVHNSNISKLRCISNIGWCRQTREQHKHEISLQRHASQTKACNPRGEGGNVHKWGLNQAQVCSTPDWSKRPPTRKQGRRES